MKGEIVNRYRLIELFVKIILWILVIAIFILKQMDVFESLPDYLETLVLALDLSAAVILSWFMPSSISERKFNKGLKLIDKDNDKAVLYLEDYLDSKTLSDIDRRHVLRILGVAKHKKGDDEGAIRCLNQALEGQDRDNDLKVEILGSMGIIYSESGEYQKAVEHFDRSFDIIFALSKAHIDKTILMQVINAYIKAGQKEKAVLIYDRLLMIRGFKRDARVEELLGI
ncbi:MAG TPA: tetratricopeptide repeat protein [Clostridia bacterium]|nr:tetratricopeptide repeat protein [Clostridia bacterium]